MGDAKDDPLSAERVRHVRDAASILLAAREENLDEQARKPFYAAIVAIADAHLTSGWRPIETAPRTGLRLLMTDGVNIQICYPKTFPRPLSERPPSGDDDLSQSKPGDVWEYFRDDEHAPGHSWSMRPTHWRPLPKLPEAGQ